MDNNTYYQNIIDALNTLSDYINSEYPQIDEDILLNIEETVNMVNNWYSYNQNNELQLEHLNKTNIKLMNILKEFNDEVDFYDDLD